MSKRVFATPQEAEAAFYRAFAQRDLDGMMAVWADDEDIICVHPVGERLQGQAAIRHSWQSIFSNGPRMSFRIEEPRVLRDERLAVHQVKERIRFEDEQDFQPPVMATNIYRLGNGGWRMVLHHASPTPPLEKPSGTVIH